jgi:hypothetical protein
LDDPAAPEDYKRMAGQARPASMALLLAAFAYGIMLIWHRGAKAVSARLQETVELC